MSALEEFRKGKDDFFRTSTDSPLNPEQKSNFLGLKYYPENLGLIFTVLIEKNIDAEEIVSIQTSAGDTEPYKRYGKIKLTVGDKEVELTVFKPTEDGELFLPFRDATSGPETYGSGRYLETEEVDGKLKVDFNYAYNPYCAYNERWRCPLTPAENRLNVRIEAGEKNFHN